MAVAAKTKARKLKTINNNGEEEIDIDCKICGSPFSRNTAVLKMNKKKLVGEKFLSAKGFRLAKTV